jgi:hypothetical protein
MSAKRKDLRRLFEGYVSGLFLAERNDSLRCISTILRLAQPMHTRVDRGSGTAEKSMLSCSLPPDVLGRIRKLLELEAEEGWVLRLSAFTCYSLHSAFLTHVAQPLGRRARDSSVSV